MEIATYKSGVDGVRNNTNAEKDGDDMVSHSTKVNGPERAVVTALSGAFGVLCFALTLKLTSVF